MAEAIKEGQTIPIRGTYGTGEDTPSVYANVVNLNWTLTDVRIRFGELIQITPPATGQTIGVVQERIAVTLPWWQAKALRDNLDTLLRSYEALNGQLIAPKLPPAQ